MNLFKKASEVFVIAITILLILTVCMISGFIVIIENRKENLKEHRLRKAMFNMLNRSATKEDWKVLNDID